MCLLLLTACENAPFRLAEFQSTTSLVTEPSILDNSSISLIQRKKQQAVIESAFSRRTSPERAHQPRLHSLKLADTGSQPGRFHQKGLVESGS